jgi:phosphoribosylformimino-5-aminoimidazole carboxamide ribotide isomerase
MMRCILACDLKGGAVVRGLRGQRDLYRPICEYSRLVSSAEPLEVIRALRPKETYVADLDRITGHGDSLPIIATLSKLTKVMADTGISCKEDVDRTKAACQSVVLGTETASLALIRECQGPGTIVSVDMKGGKMMARDRALRIEPLPVVKALNDLELGSVILLDVARVGSGEGVDFGLLGAAASLSRHDVLVGGGVRDAGDLERIEKSGAAGAIVASAVHSGALPPSVLW